MICFLVLLAELDFVKSDIPFVCVFICLDNFTITRKYQC